MIDYKPVDTDLALTGKVAIITGGATGIGFAIAETFAKKGASICILDVNEKSAKKSLTELEKNYGCKVFFQKVDVSSKESVQNAVDNVAKQMKSIDILVNSAGVVFLDDAENISEDYWDKTIAINQKGVFLMSQAVGRYMIKQGKGKIINLASQAATIALDNHIAYCATKAAVLSMTRVLAIEWAEYGINVNAISPTVVLTDLGKKAWSGQKGEDMIKLIPNGRFAYPDEVAVIALFLASESSNMINGENIIIDGGYTIK